MYFHYTNDTRAKIKTCSGDNIVVSAPSSLSPPPPPPAARRHRSTMQTTNEIIKGEFRRVFIMLFYRISLTPVTQRRTATPPMLLMLLLPPLKMMMPTKNTFFFFYFNLPMNACMREKRYWRSILQFCSLKWSVDSFLSRLIVCAVCVCVLVIWVDDKLHATKRKKMNDVVVAGQTMLNCWCCASCGERKAEEN